MIRRIFAFLLFAALAGAASAQTSAQHRWQVDWGQYYCSLILPPGEGRRFATAMMVVPGGEGTQIMFIPSGGPAPSRRMSSLLLLPQGTTFEVSRFTQERGGRFVVILSGLPYSFSDALVGGTELQFRDRDEIRLRLPLPDARAAVAAHRRCIAELARQWGIDEAALAALSRRPVSTNNFGLDSSDYPAAALRQATEGRVLVRVAVSAEGRATECTPVATSGSPVIDATTCRETLGRARFRPALDAAGQPVAVRYVSPVTWLLPDF